jgi:hypothetical protein
MGGGGTRGRTAGAAGCALATLGLVAGACSALIVDGPPPADVRPTVDFECTRTPVVPILDFIAVNVAAFRAFKDASQDDAQFQGRTLSRNQDLLVSVGALTGFFVSAGVGFARVRECEAATDERLRHPLVRPPTQNVPPAMPAPPAPETLTPPAPSPPPTVPSDEAG